ncbi:Aste57867_4707 [Aphanomyces stellatus]|uniref:Aste57867_4707 protein n=1 Tax=Aphanomyces stellatus TaxID=120398 RepID=A0A485KEC4_9STRA|nr:hypothetical protein As57867_004694 [Aphanomyces stellatus]VFT81807.1 Aste57867_4707 [Aphanomyces stellatus]
MSASASAHKTAFRHFTQFLKAPIPGVSISQLDADKFHVNTKVLEGPYAGITVHWELTIPTDYPHSPPFGRMAPGYAFGVAHHHHVFETAGICCDVLGNFRYMHQSASGYSGWTPSANFTTLMIYLQPFFADPDGKKASKETIQELMAMNHAYKCNDCGHSTQEPVPPLGEATPEGDHNAVSDDDEAKVQLTPQQVRAKHELVCGVTGDSIVDDPTVCLGYPFRLTKGRATFDVELFPEFISHAAYEDAKAAQARGHPMRTSTGHTYTHWLPLYLTPAHFQTHRELHRLDYSIDGTSKTTISLVDLLVKTMNKQVLAVMNGSGHESEAAIVAYANLLRLLRHVLASLPAQQAAVDRTVEAFIKDPQHRTKKQVPDLGEFYVKLCVSTVASIEDLQVRETLVKETFARQIRWIRKDDPACVDDPEMDTLERLGRMFQHSLVSNRITTFVMEMAKVFCTPPTLCDMDACYGLPPTTIVSEFQDRVKMIKATLVNYDVLVREWNLESVIKSADEMEHVMMEAKTLSADAGYDGRP